MKNPFAANRLLRVRMTDRELEALKRRAAREESTMSEVVREAVTEENRRKVTTRK